MAKVIKITERDKNNALAYLLIIILLLAFTLPVFLYGRPFGTDTYTHIEETQDLFRSNSLHEFYELSSSNSLHPTYEGNSYNYPFGLWLFGSVTAKIMGAEPYFVAYLLPIPFLIIVLLTFYFYSELFFEGKRERIISLLFLLSMPDFLLNLLSYRTSVFTIPFVSIITYFTLTKRYKFGLSAVFIFMGSFILSITHVGTFMFLMFFSILYCMLYVLLEGQLHRKMFLLVVSIFVSYFIGMSLFPEVLPQYVDKARLVLTVGDSISSVSGLKIVSDLSHLLYAEVYVNHSLLYTLFLIAFFFSIIELIKLIRTRIPMPKLKIKGNYFPAIPLIGNLTNISHSIIATPFWVGPLQSFLTLFGLLKLKREHLILFFSIFAVTVLPGSLSQAQTGATREIFYLYLIIPITAVFGLSALINRIKKYKRISALNLFLMFSVFSYCIITPLVGNLYYLPTISHAEYQVNGMAWLSKFGNNLERAEGFGYRDVRIFTNKITVMDQLMSGKETTYFIENLRSVLFSPDSENAVRNLYTNYNLKYYLVSNKIASNFYRDYDTLKAPSNTELDNIFTSKDFKIFSNPTHRGSYVKINGTFDESYNIDFKEEYPLIEDIGTDFLVETDTYKIRLNKQKPKITFLGDRINDLLEEGSFTDYATINWFGAGERNGKRESFTLGDLPVTDLYLDKNKLVYSSVLYSNANNETWSSIYIVYTFYDKSIKREFIISNDILPSTRRDNMEITFSSLLFLRTRNFTYTNFYDKSIAKKIYPSEDTISIEEKFKDIYLMGDDTGIYLKFVDTSPLPDSIYFKGMTAGEYAFVKVNSNRIIHTAESFHVTQYLSIGNRNLAKANVEKYANTEIFPYPNGKIPLLIVSYLENPYPQTPYENSILEKSIIGYEQLDNLNITMFSEGIKMKTEDMRPELISAFQENNISLIASPSSAFSSTLDQEAEMADIIYNAQTYGINLTGALPKGLSYDLGTVNTLVRFNSSFMLYGPLRSPVYEYYQEGMRYPQFAILEGKKTNLVLLPISGPTSSSLIGLKDFSSTTSGWRSAVSAVSKNDGLCVFLWMSEDLGNSNYYGLFDSTMNYSFDQGLTLSTPTEIASHFRKINRVHILVDGERGSLKLEIENMDLKREVQGITVKTVLSKIDGNCDYAASNGVITRRVTDQDNCRIYISTDLTEGEVKNIEIYPATKKQLLVTLPEPVIQGEVRIVLKDNYGNPVSDAILQINNKTYSSDSDGSVIIYLSKGTYSVDIEKPGFVRVQSEIIVLDKLSLFSKYLPGVGLFILLSFVVIFSLKKARFLKSS